MRTSSLHTDPQRAILITGTSSGIGHASARMMAERGWRVFAGVRNEADIPRLNALPGVTALHLDYTDQASIAACAGAVLAATDGRIHALFNNGAYGQPGAVEDLRPDVLRAQFETNFFGWHDLTCRLIPAMRAQKFGRIVQCSSLLGYLALKYRGAYTASKHALEGLTDTLRLELSGTGIDVISIQPGPIATNFVTASMQKFHAMIDIAHSPHRGVYERRLERMKRGGASTFKLPPEAVARALIQACEAKKPRPVYRITTPAKTLAFVKRFLPTSAFIALMRRISDSEQ